MSTSSRCLKCGNSLNESIQFCPNCGEKNELFSLAPQTSKKQNNKSPTVTLLLCLFFGIFGLHRFYLGKIGTGLLMLITGGGLGVWFLIDLILIVTNKFEDKYGNLLILTNNLSPTKKTILIISSIIAWFVVFFGTLFMAVLYFTSGLIYPVQSQLLSLQAGNIEKAYSYTSKDFQKATSLDDFKKFLNHYPSLKNNESSFFNTREIQDNTGILQGTLTSKDGAKTPIEYRLIKEDGSWKIIGIQLTPTGAGISIDQKNRDSSKGSTSQQNHLLNLYEDKPNKYTIKYPSNWSKIKPEKGLVMFRGKKNTPSFSITVNIQTVLTKKSGGIYSNVKELIVALNTQLSTQASDAKILSQGEMDLPTNPKRFHGEYLIFTYKYKQQEFKQMEVVFLRDDESVLYTWAYTAPTELFNLNLPIAKTMFETWTID